LDRGSWSRRSFLRGGAALLGSAALPAAFHALLLRQARAGRLRAAALSPVPNPYGAPVLTPDLTTGLDLLSLPPDFTYRSIGWTGDPMADGTPTPPAHDGMAVVDMLPGRAGDLVLIRNHEVIFGPLIGGGTSAPVYDDVRVGQNRAGGGTTTMIFRRGQLLETRPSLAGTVVNCAGGPTPWGSWLSCEETISDASTLGGRIHGFVFEVPSPARGVASAVPIAGMGLMKHEAAAVDPRSGIVYETEDNETVSGFYRYRPHDRSGRVGSLEAGGVLEMLRVVGANGADLDVPEPGAVYPVDWAPISDPSALPEGAEGSFLYFGESVPYTQGRENGAARFRRLEGCWYGAGSIWFVDTSGGAARNGVVWRYTPAADETAPGRLEAFFVSSSSDAADNIDNITVSPRGGLVSCEESRGATGNRLLGFTPDGSSFEFARNRIEIAAAIPGKPAIAPGDYRSSEWAGACFDPTGRWLFANIQKPGVTFAITGPWARGPL